MNALEAFCKSFYDAVYSEKNQGTSIYRFAMGWGVKIEFKFTDLPAPIMHAHCKFVPGHCQ